MLSLLQSSASRLPALLPTNSFGRAPPAAAAAVSSGLQACWYRGSQGTETVHAGVCAATAAGATTSGSAGQEEELGDLRPDMTLTEEEDDEAEHYRCGEKAQGQTALNAQAVC